MQTWVLSEECHSSNVSYWARHWVPYREKQQYRNVCQRVSAVLSLNLPSVQRTKCCKILLWNTVNETASYTNFSHRNRPQSVCHTKTTSSLVLCAFVEDSRGQGQWSKNKLKYTFISVYFQCHNKQAFSLLSVPTVTVPLTPTMAQKTCIRVLRAFSNKKLSPGKPKKPAH